MSLPFFMPWPRASRSSNGSTPTTKLRTNSESRLFHIIKQLLNPIFGRASLRQRVYMLQKVASFLTSDNESLTKIYHTLTLECFLGILELVRHSASQHLSAARPERAKTLLQSEEASVTNAIQLEDTVIGAMDPTKRVVAAAAGRINGRANTLKVEYEKMLGVCEAALLLERGDGRSAEDASGLSPEDLLKREQLAADDYRFVTSCCRDTKSSQAEVDECRFALHCVQSNDKELEGALLVRLGHYHLNTTKLRQR